MIATLRRGVMLSTALALAATATVLVSPAVDAVGFVDVIVVLDPEPAPAARSAASTASAARAQAGAVGGEVTDVYSRVFDGYAARIPETALAALEANPAVAWVELDQTVSVAAQEIPTGVDRVFAAGNDAIDIDATDDWRVDVDVAVLDTGIDGTHPDLDVVSEVVVAQLCQAQPASCPSPDPTVDLDGHGTHVAGTIGAIDDDVGVVGVAPGARLWNVKVLGADGTGPLSGVIAGVDWVTARADQIEVINMSLSCGGCTSSAFQTAIGNAVDEGVVVVVAAGNKNTDASDTIPASYTDAIAVSALADYDGLPGAQSSPTCANFGGDDVRASFSNYGTVVDIAAPGACIRSTWPVSEGAYATVSGTSMASPLVAGAAALLASGDGDPTSRSDVMAIRSTLLSTGNSNWTDNSGDGVKEPLLDVSGAAFAPTLVEGTDPEVTGAHGLLRVVTSPAVESQIVVNGQVRNSWGLNWVKMAPGSYEVCFSRVVGWSAPPCETVAVNEGETTAVTGVFEQRGFLRGVTSPAVPATLSVDGVPWDDWGFWTDVAPGSYEVCFGPVEGYEEPGCEIVDVTAGETTVVTGGYTEGTSSASPEPSGLLRVVTSPAVESQIVVNGQVRNSWGLNWVKMAPGSYEVCFSRVVGWSAPPCETVAVNEGETTAVTGVFEQRGFLRGVTSPAVPATLSVDGVPWDDWGFWTDVAPGSYEVCFGPVDGFIAPACETVDVTAGDTTVVTGDYLSQ